LECARCGIVFAKYRPRAADDPRVAFEVTAPDLEPAAHARDLEWWARLLLLTGLGWWTWVFARTPLGPALIDSVLHLPNLIFHEAGHVLFIPLGRFMTVLGGSLFQFLLPLGLSAAFLRQQNRFGAIVCLWWAGQNLVDVAPYIADARALKLVLIGGRTGAEVEGHDWEYILTQLGWLHRDRALGLWTCRAGLLTMCAALAAGASLLLRRRPAHASFD
jgi:hypothetical protein